MVRRGSTVRVRQRSLQSLRESGRANHARISISASWREGPAGRRTWRHRSWLPRTDPLSEGGPAMSLARVQHFSISLDGFGTGEGQSLDAPFGHAGERLHEWMFGTPWWHEDPEWKGWWGPNPPFHTPVFVLTHHQRPSIEMEGGTTYHFIDASPAEALDAARDAAGGLDVRIGGGVTVIRDFAAARLIDHMHVVVVP